MMEVASVCRIPVEVEYASEFRYRNPIIREDDIVIAVSQSGETADTLAAVEQLDLVGLGVDTAADAVDQRTGLLVNLLEHKMIIAALLLDSISIVACGTAMHAGMWRRRRFPVRRMYGLHSRLRAQSKNQ